MPQVVQTNRSVRHYGRVEYDPIITEYPVNSYVLFTPPVGRSDKLFSRHRGPYQVIERMNFIYTNEDLVNGKRITTHIHSLRPMNYNPDRTSPLSVARQNNHQPPKQSQQKVYNGVQGPLDWIRGVMRQLETLQGSNTC